MAFREYTLLELVNRLNLDYNNSGNMKCPFCEYPDPRRRNLHFNFDSNWWRCNKCEESGGVLHLFSQYVLHEHLPSSKEGRREVREKLQEFMGDDSAAVNPRDKVFIAEKPKPPAIPVAGDDHLDAVYSAMAKIPALQLLSGHRKALKSRGLSEEVIERNQYRSIPEDYDVPNFYTGMYEKEGGEILRSKLFNWYSPKRVKFGLMIAHALTSAGFDLTGVPGFFKFGEQWCMWCNPGILIPTRNFAGQIVVWQVRTKKASAKYMTLSCGSYPGAVSENVARCHVPLGNAKIGESVTVNFTEGPLKADVACELMGKPAIWLAIPGINTTKDLLKCLGVLKQQGYEQVRNCLDMDRLTNPNVRKGSRKLKEEILNLGMDVRDLFWGTPYAQQKLMALESIARMRQVTYQIHPSMTVHDRLDIVSDALCTAGIDACRRVDAKGKEHLYYWESDTKGIDDYYFDLLTKQQNTG